MCLCSSQKGSVAMATKCACYYKTSADRKRQLPDDELFRWLPDLSKVTKESKWLPFIHDDGGRQCNNLCADLSVDNGFVFIFFMCWCHLGLSDNIIIGCRRHREVEKMRGPSPERFKIDDKGSFSWFLEMQVKQPYESVTENETN